MVRLHPNPTSVSPKFLDLFEAKTLDVLLVERLDPVDPGFLLGGLELRIGVRQRFYGRYVRLSASHFRCSIDTWRQ